MASKDGGHQQRRVLSAFDNRWPTRGELDEVSHVLEWEKHGWSETLCYGSSAVALSNRIPQRLHSSDSSGRRCIVQSRWSEMAIDVIEQSDCSRGLLDEG